MTHDERDVQLAAAISACPLPETPAALGARVLRRVHGRRVAARFSAAALGVLLAAGAGWALFGPGGAAPDAGPQPAGNEPTLAGQLNEFSATPALAAPPPVAELDVLARQQDALLEELKALEQ